MQNGNVSNVVRFYDDAARSDETSLARRKEARILHLRNFNNWTKSILINKYIQLARTKFGPDVRLRVLDICCGKGGDQMKWAQHNVEHVTFIDLSGTSVEACERRYNQLSRKSRNLYTADFHVCDCTTNMTDTILRDKTYDIVSCQFSFHYAFESFEQAKTFLNNVSYCLGPGGCFIGTVPNAYEIVRRAREAYHTQSTVHSDSIQFGNSLYSIRFPKHSFDLTTPDDNDNCDQQTTQPPFPLFGAKYDFHLEDVVDCPEYLVYPPLVDHLASIYSLHPVSQNPIQFADFFTQSLTSGHNSNHAIDLLRRMKALESYKNRSIDRMDQSQTDKSYRHVEEKLRDDNICQQSCFLGTLSEDEWDVITLYSVFAYQK